MFGATGTAVYDISAVANPSTVPAAAFSGQTSGDYSTQMFTTSGGNFLYICNGTNSPRLFNGATWTAITGVSAPAITGVTTSGLSFVWSFANRLFFVEKNTTKAWYLPVSSVGGLAAALELGSIFTRGGTLMFGGTWSMDSGSGLDDKCVFVSSEGEVAIYEGSDPSSAATWNKVGVYFISKPLGKNCTMRAGGDLLIGTAFGLVPISTAVSADIGAIGMESVSKMIGAYWREQASLIGTAQWEIRKWPDAGLLVMTQPHDASGSWLMASLATGAWARGTGLVSSALTQFGVDMYMGSTNGRVYKMETTGFDDAAAYTCRYLGLHEQMGTGWNEKAVEQMRPVLSGSTPVAVQVSANTNFATDTSPPPSVVAYTASGLWDSFVWDVDAWDTSSAAGSITPGWSQVGRTGYVIAPEAQVTIGNAAKPDVELIAIETTIRPGAMVT